MSNEGSDSWLLAGRLGPAVTVGDGGDLQWGMILEPRNIDHVCFPGSKTSQRLLLFILGRVVANAQPRPNPLGYVLRCLARV